MQNIAKCFLADDFVIYVFFWKKTNKLTSRYFVLFNTSERNVSMTLQAHIFVQHRIGFKYPLFLLIFYVFQLLHCGHAAALTSMEANRNQDLLFVNLALISSVTFAEPVNKRERKQTSTGCQAMENRQIQKHIHI